tara:strand:+ start:372 stop:590 length:219 start_codon:yes stop_codon:yes gene_type:complete
MTYKDYIMWFRGYSSAIKDVPTKEQWEEIVGELKKVTDKNIPTTIFDPDKYKKKVKKYKGKDFPGKPPTIYF